MNFGEILKKIRIAHGDSLRGLAEKTGIVFTYIDKIERGQKPVNVDILEKLVKEYPLQKKELVLAYSQEMLPEFILEELKKPTKTDELLNVINNTDNSEELYKTFLKNLDNEDKKEIFKMIVERLEFLSFKKGTYDVDKEKLEVIKKAIENLK